VLYQTVATVTERSLGSEHSDTLAALSNQADCLYLAHRYGEACPFGNAA
jgi:hypothetical protein